MSETPKDVAGRELKVGQKVAYCLGNSGTRMRIGEVTRIGPKTVEIGGREGGRGGFVWREKDAQRAFGAVCIVEDVRPTEALPATMKMAQTVTKAVGRDIDCPICGGYGSYYGSHWSEGINWCPRCRPEEAAKEREQ